jgi:hypothetical protein
MARPHLSDVRDASDTVPSREFGTDDLFDALGSAWRRRAVRRLATDPSPEATEAFVAGVLADHARTDAASVRTAFHHAHLPKLDDHGVVDREAGRITPGPNLAEAAACLDAVANVRTAHDER